MTSMRIVMVLRVELPFRMSGKARREGGVVDNPLIEVPKLL